MNRATLESSVTGSILVSFIINGNLNQNYNISDLVEPRVCLLVIIRASVIFGLLIRPFQGRTFPDRWSIENLSAMLQHFEALRQRKLRVQIIAQDIKVDVY